MTDWWGECRRSIGPRPGWLRMSLTTKPPPEGTAYMTGTFRHAMEGRDEMQIPGDVPEWPSWGRVPTFFEQSPQLQDEEGSPVRRLDEESYIERRTRFDGELYLIRGSTRACGVYRYTSTTPGDRIARCVFRHQKSIHEVMDNLPMYLVYHAFD